MRRRKSNIIIRRGDGEGGEGGVERRRRTACNTITYL
jgi:hypothetical protein